jgi:hypothetical protein
MRIRRRNWFIKRIALGFAVAALIAPAAAQARVDEGGKGQPNSANEVVVKAGDYGMPRAMPNDYALQSGDAIEVARTHERNAVRDGDLIENVRLAPRSVSTPELVSSPGFNWGDAGIGAGLIFGLVLAGGAAFYGTRHLGRAQTA